jgi:hypothetical protein
MRWQCRLAAAVLVVGDAMAVCSTRTAHAPDRAAVMLCSRWAVARIIWSGYFSGYSRSGSLDRLLYKRKKKEIANSSKRGRTGAACKRSTLWLRVATLDVRLPDANG